jgi:hypothetical protein
VFTYGEPPKTVSDNGTSQVRDRRDPHCRQAHRRRCIISDVSRPSASNALQEDLWNRRARLMSMLRRTPKSRHVIRRSACLSQHFDLTKTRPRTTRHDRWARLAGMGDMLQHESLIATLQSSWSKSCKHLLSSTLPEQPDSCPLRGQTNQDRLLRTSRESVPVYLFPERRDRDLLSTRSRRSGKCRLDAMCTSLGLRIQPWATVSRFSWGSGNSRYSGSSHHRGVLISKFASLKLKITLLSSAHFRYTYTHHERRERT